MRKFLTVLVLLAFCCGEVQAGIRIPVRFPKTIYELVEDEYFAYGKAKILEAVKAYEYHPLPGLTAFKTELDEIVRTATNFYNFYGRVFLAIDQAREQYAAVDAEAMNRDPFYHHVGFKIVEESWTQESEYNFAGELIPAEHRQAPTPQHREERFNYTDPHPLQVIGQLLRDMLAKVKNIKYWGEHEWRSVYEMKEMASEFRTFVMNHPHMRKNVLPYVSKALRYNPPIFTSQEEINRDFPKYFLHMTDVDFEKLLEGREKALITSLPQSQPEYKGESYQDIRARLFSNSMVSIRELKNRGQGWMIHDAIMRDYRGNFIDSGMSDVGATYSTPSNAIMLYTMEQFKHKIFGDFFTDANIDDNWTYPLITRKYYSAASRYAAWNAIPGLRGKIWHADYWRFREDVKRWLENYRPTKRVGSSMYAGSMTVRE